MRKTILSIIFLVILLLVPTIVFAADGEVAKVGEKTYGVLEDALDAARTNGEDVVILQTINVNNELTINLDGVNIKGDSDVNPVFNVEDGTVNVTGTGTITGTGDVFYVLGNTGSDYATKSTKSEVVIGANVNITAIDNCIYIKGNGAKADVYGSLTSTGEYATIQGNGKDSSGNTVINIYAGASVLHNNNHAIYHPQSGELNIYGGTIKGITGVEIRAGKLLVEDGANITSTYNNGALIKSNPNGTTTDGAGIAVAQHTTGKAIDVVINGGTIKGYYAVNESNPEHNTDDILANVSIVINDGKFETIDGPAAVWSDSKKLSITGGTFNKYVKEEYLADGVTAEEDSNGNYVVGTRYNVKIEETMNGGVISSVEKALEGEKVQLTINPENGYELSKLTVLNADNNEIEVVNGAFTMPAGGVTVTAEFAIVKTEIDYVVPEDKSDNNIGIVESEKVKETLDTSLKADTKLNQKVEEVRQNGETVTIEIKMEALEKDAVKDEEKQKILQTMTANQKVHQYFDISVSVTSDKTGELGKITKLTEKMKFSIEIPEDLMKEGRNFHVIKLHGEGDKAEVERLEATLNGTKLEFETAHFSTFALAYEDAVEEDKTQTPVSGEKDETPKTGVINIPAYVWVSIAGMAIVGILTTKKTSKHSK